MKRIFQLKKQTQFFPWGLLKIIETFPKKKDYRIGARVFYFSRTATAQKILKPEREGR